MSVKIKSGRILLSFDVNMLIDDAEIVHVQLKDLCRKWDGKLYRLAECSQFKCLQTIKAFAQTIFKNISTSILLTDADKYLIHWSNR